jgi:hypothetical protein
LRKFSGGPWLCKTGICSRQGSQVTAFVISTEGRNLS